MATTKFKPVDEQLSHLKKGTAEIIPENELRAKLERSIATGKPLRVYLGVDPTAPDIHLGHTVVLRKLKHFQDMGHTAIFLIGDFSAMIGDPTGQSETRPPLTREQVDANAKTYLAQVYKILDREKTEVRYNSEWLGKMSSYDVVRLCGHYRLARMLEREDFRSRLEKNQPISVHELLYPLLTAYDAVELQSDVELGATEQKFNMLVHRDIQREYGVASEVVLTMPILVGLDGERKMSKSLGNYVGITEAPGEMFGKLMSISDELMWSYYELLTDFAWPVVVRLREEVRTGVLHPKKAKMELAHNIVAGFHGEDAARKAAEGFDQVYSKRQLPSEMTERTLSRKELVQEYAVHDGKMKLSRIIVREGLASSKAEAERLMTQGAVEWDGKKVTDPTFTFDLNQQGDHVLRVGKKPPFLVRIAA
ncbi:MAG TPA: tyrosine--tRNA ligase [Verrucomicrobiae bacterium]|nr:tyrosine--tRNA ligase [Verrucomicrobiae bacterium]